MKLKQFFEKKLNMLRSLRNVAPPLYYSAINEIRAMAAGENSYGLREQCYAHPDYPNQTVPDVFFVGLLQELGEQA